MKRAPLVLGIGVLLVPLAFVITGLQWLLYQVIDLIGTVTGEGAGAFAFLAVVVGATLTLMGLGLVQAAMACALLEIDAGRQVDPVRAYRLALRRIRPLLGGIAIFVAVWVALTTTAILIPVAIWLAVRWSLLAPVVELEDGRAGGRVAPAQRPARPPALGLRVGSPRWHQRRSGARSRPARRCAAHLCDQHAARPAQCRRGARLRAGDALRRTGTA